MNKKISIDTKENRQKKTNTQISVSTKEEKQDIFIG